MNREPYIEALSDALRSLEQHLGVEASMRDTDKTLAADLDSNLAFLADLREQKARLTAIENEVERVAARQMPGKDYMAGGITAERNRSYADTWDVRRTAWALVEPLCVDHETGELRVEEKVAWELIDRLLSAAAVGYYRVKELQSAGLDPSEFRARELRRTTVKVTRSAPAEGVA